MTGLHLNKFEVFSFATTIFFILLGVSGVVLSKSLSLVIFIGIMLITGIPHGAIDHYLFARIEKQGLYTLRFFIIYLGLIGLYALFWVLFPVLSLALFFLLAIYHFGQSQLFYIKIPEGHPLKMLVYVTWGGGILGAMTYFNSDEALAILDGIIHKESWGAYFINELLIWIFSALLMVFFLVIVYLNMISKKVSNKALIKELISLCILLLLFKVQNILITFGIYFGCWHSLQAIHKEIQTLHSSKQPFNLLVFYKAALPFTLISCLGVMGLILAASLLQGMISPIMLFFIAISLLTFPHTLIMSKVYLE